MFPLKRLMVGSLFVFVLADTAVAQESRAPIDNPQQPVPATAPLVTATATSKRVRFVSPGTVLQLRLEVYNEAGQKLFDTELRGGNVLDWHFQDGSGERVPAGSYASVLTIKSLSGRLSQRMGVVRVSNKKAVLAADGAGELSVAQQQTIGPVEANSALTILQSESEAITAVTHDGADGQLTSTTGALTFRTGDVFAGKDKEQMRITEDGRVGVGTDKPEATLDVAGTVRVSEGIKFSDGTTLDAASGKLKVRDAAGEVMVDPAAEGTGSINRLAKWAETGGVGTLTDAAAAEESGLTIFGQNSAGQVAPLFPSAANNHVLEVGVAPGGKSPLTLAGGSGVMEFWKDLGGGTGAPAAAVGFGMARPGLSATDDMVFSTYTPGAFWNERMRITTAGNVGVGTNNPTTKLDVAGNIKTSGSLTSATANVINQLVVDTNTLVVDAANNRVGVGTLTPDVPLDVVGDINTSTRYNIAGSRVLSNAGLRNLFAGVGAGAVNTAQDNSFFGSSAGAANTGGNQNSFFGSSAGEANTEAQGNSFFGADAGRSNTGGQNNSFFGLEAGESNTNGMQNAFFGVAAGAANTTASGNSFFGYGAGQANVTGSQNSFFGYTAGASNTANSNSFFGSTAGNANDEGESNSFFGSNAGLANISGDSNSFFGANAGADTGTSDNSFFGKDAGLVNTGGNSLSFFGKGAGAANTNGTGNSFFGMETGLSNTTGEPNSFFGMRAGYSNIDGDQNSFFGYAAGYSNTSGNSNTFFGDNAGASNTSEHNNTFLGASSNGAAGVTNATAIGANAVVTQSNSLVLGNGVKVGVGISAPREKLHVLNGNIFIEFNVDMPNPGLILKSPNGMTCAKLTIDNAGALVTTVITCP